MTGSEESEKLESRPWLSAKPLEHRQGFRAQEGMQLSGTGLKLLIGAPT